MNIIILSVLLVISVVLIVLIIKENIEFKKQFKNTSKKFPKNTV